MGETVSVKNGSTRQAKGLDALQARFDALEAGARERLVKALGAGQHKLGELDGALERMGHEDWTVVGMRKRLEAIRARADSLRTTALKRVGEVPATAMTAFTKGSRAQVQSLSRELERLAKLIEVAPAVKDVRVEVKAPEVVVTEKPSRASKAKVEV